MRPFRAVAALSACLPTGATAGLGGTGAALITVGGCACMLRPCSATAARWEADAAASTGRRLPGAFIAVARVAAGAAALAIAFTGAPAELSGSCAAAPTFEGVGLAHLQHKKAHNHISELCLK